MFNNNKILGIIPARRGSKRIKDKNKTVLAGKPLITHTITEAMKSKYIDQVVLSTDDSDIISIGIEYGIQESINRPAELAVDNTSGIAVVHHILKLYSDFQLVVLLQPTSPLRIVNDIDGAIEKMISLDAPACISVSELQKSPYWIYNINSDQKLISFFEKNIEEQKNNKAYIINGAVYVAKTDWLIDKKSFLSEETIGYTMPIERSIDIDEKIDLEYAEFLMSLKKHT